MISLENLKTFMKLDINDTSKDGILGQCLDMAVNFIKNETGIIIGQEHVVETFIGNGLSTRYTEFMPIKNINAFTKDGANYKNSIKFVDKDTGFIMINGIFNNMSVYTLDYDCGYNNEPPKELEFITFTLASSFYYSFEKIKDNIKSIGTADGTIFYNDYIINPDVKKMIEKWRRLIV